MLPGGLIVDGGQGRRLGSVHKASLLVSGRTIAERTVAVLREDCGEILAASPHAELWRRLGVRCVADAVAGAGPLGGIAAGLCASGSELVVTVAADMPCLSPAVLRELVARALAAGTSAVPVRAGRPEPLHAVYLARDGGAAIEALSAGARKLTDWLARVQVEWVDADELALLPGAAHTFDNVNGPEDLAALP